MTEIEKLKQAFEKWAIKTEQKNGRYSTSPNASHIEPEEIAELFFPFVEFVLNDETQSAQKLALINTFKFKLGMELMAHEWFGVEKK